MVHGSLVALEHLRRNGGAILTGAAVPGAAGLAVAALWRAGRR